MVFPSWARRCCQTPLGTTTGASDAWAAEMCPCAGYYLISFDHKEEIDFAASFSAVCRNWLCSLKQQKGILLGSFIPPVFELWMKKAYVRQSWSLKLWVVSSLPFAHLVWLSSNPIWSTQARGNAEWFYTEKCTLPLMLSWKLLRKSIVSIRKLLHKMFPNWIIIQSDATNCRTFLNKHIVVTLNIRHN